MIEYIVSSFKYSLFSYIIFKLAYIVFHFFVHEGIHQPPARHYKDSKSKDASGFGQPPVGICPGVAIKDRLIGDG